MNAAGSPPSPLESTNDRASLRIIACGSVIVFMVVAAVTWLAAWVCFGDVASALAYANGEVALVDPPIANLGEIGVGQESVAEFKLKRLAFSAFTVVGANPGCSCEVVQGLPVVVDREPVLLKISYTPGASVAGKLVEREIPLHLNVNAIPTVLRFRAFVRPKSAVPDPH